MRRLTPGRLKRRHIDAAQQRVVPLSTLIVSVLLAGLVAGSVVGAVDRLALGAPAGPQGPPGPAGDAGELDAEQVWEVLEADPERLAGLLDPTPTELAERDDELASEIENAASTLDDVTSDVEQVTSDLDSLCSALSLTDALSDELVSCP